MKTITSQPVDTETLKKYLSETAQKTVPNSKAVRTDTNARSKSAPVASAEKRGSRFSLFGWLVSVFRRSKPRVCSTKIEMKLEEGKESLLSDCDVPEFSELDGDEPACDVTVKYHCNEDDNITSMDLGLKLQAVGNSRFCRATFTVEISQSGQDGRFVLSHIGFKLTGRIAGDDIKIIKIHPEGRESASKETADMTQTTDLGFKGQITMSPHAPGVSVHANRGVQTTANFQKDLTSADGHRKSRKVRWNVQEDPNAGLGIGSRDFTMVMNSCRALPMDAKISLRMELQEGRLRKKKVIPQRDAIFVRFLPSETAKPVNDCICL